MVSCGTKRRRSGALGVLAPLLLLVGIVAAVISNNNGASRPLKGHEIFVAETAGEMIERGAYLVPYYNGEPRLKKPPLSYWLTVLSHELIGAPGSPRVTELEARLPSLVSGILLLVVTFLLGAAAFDDRRVGLLAAAILATTWLFFVFSRNARPEMLYALFCTAQALGIMIAVRRHSEGKSSMPGAALAWAAMAGAVLAKGPHFPVFLLAGAIPALLIRSPRPSLARVLRPGLGIAILSLVLPYFIYLAFQADGAASLWMGEMLQEKLVPLWLRPLRLYYPWALVWGVVPWLVVLGWTVVHCWKTRHPDALVLVGGILVSLAVLSFAGKLRQHYVLPLIPLCAVLAAWASVALYERAREEERARTLMRALMVSQAALIGALLVAGGWFAREENPVSGRSMWPDAMPWLLSGAALAGLAWMFASRRPAWASGALAASALAASAAAAVAGFDVSRYWATAAEFGAGIARRVPAGQPLLFQGVHSAALIYYGRRHDPEMPVEEWIAANPGRELPLLVCRNRCVMNGVALDGRVLLRQRDLGQRRRMVLFDPGAVPLRQSATPPDRVEVPGSANSKGGQYRAHATARKAPD